MAVYVEAVGEYHGDAPVLFLAGGITDCPDWQEEARALLDDLPIAIVNPRRRDFPMLDPTAAEEQVTWEYRYLQRADVILFWFVASPSPQPIALYELGAHAALGEPVAVGADQDYLRRADVLIQLRLARPELTVHDTLPEVCAEARRLIGRTA